MGEAVGGEMADYLYLAEFADRGGFISSSLKLQDVELEAERSADKFNTIVKITKARVEWDGKESKWVVVGKWTSEKSVKPYRLRRKSNPFLQELVSGLTTGTGMGVAAGITAPIAVELVKKAGRQIGIGKGKGKRKKQGNKGNPAESLQEAEELSSSFHGRPVQEIYTEEEVVDYRTNLAGLGQLRELEILDRTGKYSIPISFDYGRSGRGIGRGVTLASDPDGTQLLLVGGNQKLDLDKLDVPKKEQGKDMVEVGEVLTVSYFTDKHHLSGPSSQKNGCEYIHTFGEKGGARPVLVYDRLSKGMVLVGGEYKVVEEGIVD